jgi:hypothetical protein
MFREIGTEPSIEKAFAKGRTSIETTAAASFRIEGPTDLTLAYKRFLPEKKFRKAKKEPGVYVQKRRFRIFSPGEKFEISRKGQLAQKTMRIRKGLFGGF